MSEPMDYHQFEIIQGKVEDENSPSFLSLNADYYGGLHLRNHYIPEASQLSDLPTENKLPSLKTEELYSFDNQVRISAMRTSPWSPNSLILGDIEGNLKLFHIEESIKKNQREAKMNLLINSDNVTNFKKINYLQWVNKSHILALGNDNSINIIEPSTLQANFRINTKFATPLTASKFKSSEDNILVGFEDGYIKLFDLRKNQRRAERLFKSHSKGISCISTNQFDNGLFLSGDLDGLVKVWDYRSDLPLFSITTVTNSKIFSLNWVSKTGFVSGGDDTCLTFHSLDSDN